MHDPSLAFLKCKKKLGEVYGTLQKIMQWGRVRGNTGDPRDIHA